jgi:hypothetical protein
MFVGLLLSSCHTNIVLFFWSTTSIVLFELTKTAKEWKPTIDRLVKVIALWFQDAVGQNFGWWNERAKKEKEKRKIVKKWICYYFFEEGKWTCLKETSLLTDNEKHCRMIVEIPFGSFVWFWDEI